MQLKDDLDVTLSGFKTEVESKLESIRLLADDGQLKVSGAKKGMNESVTEQPK